MWPWLPHASSADRTHYIQWCCLHQMRDAPRQIPHSKLPRPIYDVLTQFKCPVDRLILLCCDAVSGLDTFHCYATKQVGVNSSSAARALCGIGIAAYVATFLVNIFHLLRSRSYFDQFGESLTNRHLYNTAGRLQSRVLENTCTNADGWHEWKLF